MAYDLEREYTTIITAYLLRCGFEVAERPLAADEWDA